MSQTLTLVLASTSHAFAAMYTCFGADRAIAATRRAIATWPLGQRSIQKATGVFVIVTGGADPSTREFDEVDSLIKGLTDQCTDIAIAAPMTYEGTGALAVSSPVASRGQEKTGR